MSLPHDLGGLVYAALKKNQPLSVQELAELVNTTPEAVRFVLADLGSDGIRVWADSQGKFSIVTKTFSDDTSTDATTADAPVADEANDSAQSPTSDTTPKENPAEKQSTDSEPFDFPSSQERGETFSDATSTTNDAAAQSENTPISAQDTAENSQNTSNPEKEQLANITNTPDLEALRTQKQQEEEAEKNPEEKPMTLMGHLNELRWRLCRCVIAALLGFVACYSVADILFGELLRPLANALPENSKLIYTALPEAFFTQMQVAFVSGLFLVSPYVFYQIWAFIAPGLYDEEKRFAIPIAIASALFFIGGACFCYFIVFPFAFVFFMGFATETIQPMPSLAEYLSFALKLLFAFGLIFEMPLFTFFLARMGVLTAAMMRSARRYAVLGIFIVAAILTPPDVMSQLLMACPMLLLYEVSIMIAVVFGRKPKKADSAQEQEQEQKQEKE